MIGNDVVDLDLAKLESNWARKGYLDKIFTEKEQHLIRNSDDPDQKVWLIWSCKEAAYKIRNRTSGIRKYDPIKFEYDELVISDTVILGSIIYEKCLYFTKSIVTKCYIHTISVSDVLFFDRIYVKFSTSGKINLVDNFIEKDGYGAPLLRNAKSGESAILSISHHGRFCSYICTNKIVVDIEN